MKSRMDRLMPYMHRIYGAAFALCMLVVLTSLSPQPKSTPSNYEDRIRAQFRAQRWEEGNLILDSALAIYPDVSAFSELKGQYILHGIDAGSKAVRKMGTKKAYEQARFYLIKSIDLDEKNLNSRRLLVKVEIDTKQYSSAIVYCNELLEQNPYNEHLWRTKIDLYRKLGNDEEADRQLERLLTIYHDDVKLRKDVVERKMVQADKQRRSGNYLAMEKSLRDIIELQPDSSENYQNLFSLLYRNGRLEDAAQVAEQAANNVMPMSRRAWFIGKRVELLMEMNRLVEAQNYLNTKRSYAGSIDLQRVKSELDIELARSARLNDPYEAYAKVYEKQHSQEALNYLVGTSIQRNYYDDALYYIREALKRTDSPKLRYQEYLVLKRIGHTKKATSMLRELHERVPGDEDIAIELAEIYLNEASILIAQDQYDEAIPLLTYVYTMKAEPELTNAAMTKLRNCYVQTKQYDLAEAVLDSAALEMPEYRYCILKSYLLDQKGRSKDALSMLATEFRSLPDTLEQERVELSIAYEDIVVPYIKSLQDLGMSNAAWTQVQEALEVCPESNDILHYAITLSLAQHNKQRALAYAQRGKEVFPDDPYFKLKSAQIQIDNQEFVSTVDSLRALLDIYPSDSTIIFAFTDCSENLALKYMKEKENEKAMAVLDTALLFNPASHSLLYTKSLLYRKMKDWAAAEESLKGYKPDFREYASYKRTMEELVSMQMQNSLTLEYQYARLGSEDAITGNAYMSYTRKLPRTTRKGEKRTDALSLSLAYAGRDGKADGDDADDMTKGGTGVMLSLAYERQFTNRFSGRAEVGWSNRYFPTFIANVSGSYDLKNDWQLTGRANFRWLKTYAGVYGLVHEIAAYDGNGDPVYADVMKQTGWKIKNKPMMQLGIGANKTLGYEERFNIAAGVDGFMLSNNFYVNGNAKMTFFPLQDKKSFIFAQGGLGTAPESSLIDQSLAVGFSDLNTFVSLGCMYFYNRHITLGLNGSWYTMLTQKETLSLPLNGNKAQTTKNYSNYFYVHGSLILNF